MFCTLQCAGPMQPVMVQHHMTMFQPRHGAGRRYNNTQAPGGTAQGGSHNRRTMLLHDWLIDDGAKQRTGGQRAWSGNVQQFLNDSSEAADEQQESAEQGVAPAPQPRGRQGRSGVGPARSGYMSRSPPKRHAPRPGRGSGRGQPSSRGPANARGQRR